MTVYAQNTEIIPPVAGKSVWRRAVLLTAILGLAGCFPIDDGFNPEDWSWDAGGGKVYIRIALKGARFAVDLDNPTREHIGWFEAVFKENTTADYYLGSATAGEDYITVAVPYGKTYDILVLAGTPANGQVSNGVKVLLASGLFLGYSVAYGQNIVSVPMKLHKTTDSLAWDETAEEFTYTPRITGIDALQSAKTGANLFYDVAPRAYLTPYPEVYSAAHQRPAIAVSEGAGSVDLAITDTLPSAAKSGVLYRCYYNLTYYGFSDSSSGSGPWNIRRGVTNQLYTQETSYGGGVPISSCYYVSASGDDGNIGYLEEKPFKTLAKAVKAVRQKTIPWIKTITALGELNQSTEGGSDGNGVFVIQAPAPGEYAGLIRITGGGSGVLSSGMTGRRVLYITGANTKIQLDHIAITGASNVSNAAGICLDGDAELILEAGGIIEGNTSVNSGARGGGVLTLGTSVFTMKNGSIRNNRNQNGFGGGIYIGENSTFIMEGGDITGNYSASHGGGVHLTGANTVPKFYMSGGVITGNRTLQTGGGVVMANGETWLSDGIQIYNNIAGVNGQNLGVQPGYNGRLYYNGLQANTLYAGYYENGVLGPMLP
ncbi:MAG: right-handed parallel beta-helix repeat-containing protein [Spirochaetaceae bacterium]|jgi:hypothetical protein|nr:right-handed parallel beta-helix repeat-containing protein [Spirochaetaceae bacterium]